MWNQDTIAAIATGMGSAGIGIIRISGPEAFGIAEKIFRPAKKGKKLSEQKTYTLHYGNIADGEEILDEVIVLLMRGPHSYTAEDTVEIDCHGGVYVQRRILELAVRSGARPADPGEFTKRAFLNGRIDLSQAEAVIDVIQAKNEYALKASVRQLRGSLRDQIKGMRERILYELARIESALDDPEHLSLTGYPEELAGKLRVLQKEMEEMLRKADQGRVLREGIRTVIIGRPNAGKSSLMNVLLGDDRAIVTDIAGTTRDTLEEEIHLRGLTLQIVDTAGIRRTEDVIEKIGVEKAKASLEDADLILYVVDGSGELDENDEEIIRLLKDRKVIILLNKTDLQPVTTPEKISARLAKPVAAVSAKEETGIDELAGLLEEMFLKGKLSCNDEVFLTNIRQKALLEEARDSIEKTLESISLGMPEDFYSIDLKDAYEALGKMIGEEPGEDLIDEIFSKFCMGK